MEPSKIKLSEAIRLGIGLCEQTTLWGGCTLGTALRAVGAYDAMRSSVETVRALWPWLTVNQIVQIEAMNGFRTILHTREEVAAFVETIEPQEIPMPVLDVQEAPCQAQTTT